MRPLILIAFLTVLNGICPAAAQDMHKPQTLEEEADELVHSVMNSVKPHVPCVPMADGNPSSGYSAHSCGDYVTALRIFRPLAEQGDPNAQSMLGSMYEEGHGVPQNYSEAMQWYRKAADQGDAAAQSSLGYMYQLGEGVPQDYAEAVKWHRLAADQDDAGAMRALAKLYKAGHGVQQSDTEAAKWMHKVDNQDKANAEYSYGLRYYNGGASNKQPGATHDYAEAMRRFRKAADYGKIKALSAIGIMYEKGNGVQQNYSEAAKWYRKAAEQGDGVAQDFLGNMYEKGNGVLQDYVQAYMWYNLAAASSADTGQLSASARDDVAAKMTPEQIAEAQELSKRYFADYAKHPSDAARDPLVRAPSHSATGLQ